jgi:hypothetical protein
MRAFFAALVTPVGMALLRVVQRGVVQVFENRVDGDVVQHLVRLAGSGRPAAKFACDLHDHELRHRVPGLVVPCQHQRVQRIEPL